MPAGTAQKRPYSSALRAEQAEQTRRRVLDAAAQCFAEAGYAGTSLAQIARAAGVSVDTVQATGPKRELLLGGFERAVAGVETKDGLAESADYRSLVELDDLPQLLAAAAAVTVQTNARIARLWAVFRGAALADPGVRELIEPLIERRRRDHRAVVEMLAAKGARLPVEVRDRVADELVHVLEPHGYTHFVVESGWSEQAYGEWLLARLEDLTGVG